MKSQSLTMAQIIQIGVSIILMSIGILLFTGVLDANDPRYWLAVVLVLAGVFTSTISPTVALVLSVLGGYLLLRDLGVIETPWVGLAFGIAMVAVGIYGVVRALTPDTAARVADK